MKKKYLALCTALVFTEGASASIYDTAVNLKDVIVKNGDKFRSNANYVILSERDNLRPINLGQGKIAVEMISAIENGRTRNDAILLLGNLSHNLGVGTKITTDLVDNNTGIRIEGGSLTADNIEINTNSGKRNMTIGIEGRNTKIKLGNDSKIVSINHSDGPIWNDGVGIALYDSKLSETNRLTIESKDFGSGVYLNNGQADLGEGSKINAGFMGVLLTGDDSEFTADKITINVDAKERTTADPSAGIHINAGKGTVDLGKHSVITTSGKNNSAILMNSGSFEAQDLTLLTTGINSSAINTENSTVKITNSHITALESSAIKANASSEITLEGDNTIWVKDNKNAFFSANGSNIKQEGTLNSKGNIATRGGSISLNTKKNDLRNSTVTGSLNNTEGGEIDWIGTDTIWNVTDNSRLNSLNLTQNSNINFAYSKRYNDISVHDLSGSTNLNFKVNFDNNSSDTLYVTGSSKGAHSVSLVNDGKAATNGTEKKDIIFTQDGKATFKAERDYEFGGYLYTVQRKDKDADSPIWEVASTGKKTEPAKISVSSVVGNYLLNLVELENLQKRMSALRNDQEQYGVWARTHHGKLDSFVGQQMDDFDMKYSGVQIGADKVLYKDEDKTWLLGASLNYTDSKQNYFKGSGKQKSYSAAIYATYFNSQDWYVDLYGKYSDYRNKLDMKDSVGKKVSGKGDGYALTTSAEVGKRFYFGEDEGKSAYIEPHAQLIISDIRSGKIKNSNGLDVKFDKQSSTITKVGTNIGYKFKGDTPVSIYGKVSFAHEYNGKQHYSLNGNREKLSLANNWVEVGVGANVNIKKNNNVFVEFNGSKGNKFNKYDVNLGYRYSF